MPDILIRGMEMPKTCSQCGFRCYDPHRQPSDGLGKGTNVCWFTQEEIWNTQRGERCPLLELPTHGDLISRDDLLHTMRCHLALYDSCPEDLSLADKSRRDEIQNAIADIFNEPAIVPAERRDADA